MAVMAGESGAWANVRQHLREKFIDVSSPAELLPLLHTLQQKQAQGEGLLRKLLEEELALNAAALFQAHTELPSKIAGQNQLLLEEARQIERDLSVHRCASWLKRYTVLLLPIARLHRRKKALYRRKEQITSTLHQDLARRQQQHDYMCHNRPLVVAKRLQQIADQCACVDQVLHSPQLAGARAELDVLACLRNLPNDYYVHGDLKLRAHRKIRFTGEYLQSAQIDYLVVGPTGVFVVEVKCWGRQHIARNGYHDPYEQVGRHSYLCYDLIRTYGEKARVQSVIVNCGILPPPRGDDYHVQVVTLPNLLGFLSRRRGKPLEGPAMSQIVRVLKEFSR